MTEIILALDVATADAGRQMLDRVPDLRWVKLGPGLQGGFHLGPGIKHQVNVGRDRLRLVPEEAERISPASLPAHVGTQKRSGCTLLLRVPGGSTARQITAVDTRGFALLQVSPESRMPSLDQLFREIAVDDRQGRLDPRVAVGIGLDYRVGQTP